MTDQLTYRFKADEAEEFEKFLEEHSEYNKKEALEQWILQKRGGVQVNVGEGAVKKVADKVHGKMEDVITETTGEILERGLDGGRREMEEMKEEIRETLDETRGQQQPIIIQPSTPQKGALETILEETVADTLKKELTRNKADAMQETADAIKKIKELDIGQFKIDGDGISAIAGTVDTYLEGRNKTNYLQMKQIVTGAQFAQVMALLERVEKMPLSKEAKSRIALTAVSMFMKNMGIEDEEIEEEIEEKTTEEEKGSGY